MTSRFDVTDIVNSSNEIIFNGNFYRLVREPVSFEAALQAAGSTTLNGTVGHLVTITSEAENQALWKAFVEPSDGVQAATPWIALSDKAQEDTWIWQAGPEQGAEALYQPWATGEPSNHSDEDHAVLHWQREAGGWFDYSAERRDQWYIVEFEGSENNPPSGTVEIVGTAEEGETLTAVTETLSDEDGFLEVNRVSLANAPAETRLWTISGVPLRVSDLGATFPSGMFEGSGFESLSLGTDGSLTFNGVNPRLASLEGFMNYADGGEYAFDGEQTEFKIPNDALVYVTPAYGELFLFGHDAARKWGLSEGDLYKAPEFNYQWLRSGEEIPGATAVQYQLTEKDVGQTIRVNVEYVDGFGNIEVLTSAPTETVEAVFVDPAFDITLTSTSGDVATFEVYATEATDSGDPGLDDVQFVLSHKAEDMTIDVASIDLADDFGLGIPNYDEASGELGVAAIAVPPVTDLTTPILTFDATILNEDTPFGIAIDEVLVDDTAQPRVEEQVDFSAITPAVEPLDGGAGSTM